MASVAFFGFDLWKTGVGVPTGGTNVNFDDMCKQPGFYSAFGFDTLDPHSDGLRNLTTTVAGVDAGTGAWGYLGGVTTGSNRTTLRTAKICQCAMLRSAFGVGAETWMTMDFKIDVAVATSYTSAYSPTDAFAQMFLFGDVTVRMKSVTWNGGTSQYDCVVSVYNATTEVATVSFSTTTSTWNFLKVHAKLDATTGLIDVVINNNAQSASYTGQNTVSVIALASATGIFFGTPVLDNGTNTFQGAMDNVYFDDAAWPSGRPTARKLALSGETATGWAAVGNSPTTVRDALTSDLLSATAPNDKAARGTTAGSDVLFDITAPTTADLDTDVLGFQIGTSGVHNRNAAVGLRLSAGVSLSGTHNMGTVAAGSNLPLDRVTTPQSGSTLKFLDQIWEKPAAAGPYAKTDLANIKPRLLVV